MSLFLVMGVYSTTGGFLSKSSLITKYGIVERGYKVVATIKCKTKCTDANHATFQKLKLSVAYDRSKSYNLTGRKLIELALNPKINTYFT